MQRVMQNPEFLSAAEQLGRGLMSQVWAGGLPVKAGGPAGCLFDVPQTAQALFAGSEPWCPLTACPPTAPTSRPPPPPPIPPPKNTNKHHLTPAPS